MTAQSYREPDLRAENAKLRERVTELEGELAARPVRPFGLRLSIPWPSWSRVRAAMPVMVLGTVCLFGVAASVLGIRQCHAEHEANMAEYEERRTTLCEHACPGEVVDISGGWAEVRCLCATPGGDDSSGLTVVRPWSDE